MRTNDLSSAKPEILEMPSRKMAAIYARGVPEEVFPRVLPDLYASVYTLNMALEKEDRSTFSIGGWCARYPDAYLVPVTEWTNVIGVPVPEATTTLPQKVGGHEEEYPAIPDSEDPAVITRYRVLKKQAA